MPSNTQRHQAEYDRLVALRMEAGPSNPQQGCVGTKRAKVQRKTRIAGTIRGLAIWTLSPEYKNLGWQPPPPGPLQSGVPTQAASAPSALGPFHCRLGFVVWISLHVFGVSRLLRLTRAFEQHYKPDPPLRAPLGAPSLDYSKPRRRSGGVSVSGERSIRRWRSHTELQVGASEAFPRLGLQAIAVP